jgi:hypothetical protein
MNWLDATIEFGLVTGTLEPADSELIKGCFATRGPRKGKLLSSAPSGRKDPSRAAAWQAIISAIAPARLGIGTLLFMPAESRATFRRIEQWSSARLVMSALNSYGQNPCEFNLFHLNYEPAPAGKFTARLQAAITEYLATRPIETPTPEDFAR